MHNKSTWHLLQREKSYGDMKQPTMNEPSGRDRWKKYNTVDRQFVWSWPNLSRFFSQNLDWDITVYLGNLWHHYTVILLGGVSMLENLNPFQNGLTIAIIFLPS